jgi:2-dehydropantoate 2-reductase
MSLKTKEKLPKICIVGAGAIGGFIATRLAVSGKVELSAIARGTTLDALRQYGWRLEHEEKLLQCPAEVADKPEALGIQDIVILTLKANALHSVAPTLLPLIGKHTVVVSAMNGIPWWFARELESQSGAPLESVNPEGAISEIFPYRNTVGAVIHASVSRPEPGLVRVNMGNGIILGEPEGEQSEKVQQLTALLAQAGFDAKHSDNIRRDIWYKLWGNMTINPVSAITGATADAILSDTLVRNFCSAAMEEAATIGGLLGCHIDESPEQRHDTTARLGAFKTSMLQDVEAMRPIELDAIVGSVHEIARRLGVITPNIDALFGLTRLFAQTRGLYPKP